MKNKPVRTMRAAEPKTKAKAIKPKDTTDVFSSKVIHYASAIVTLFDSVGTHVKALSLDKKKKLRRDVSRIVKETKQLNKAAKKLLAAL